MNLDELGAHVVHIRATVDEIKAENVRQWEKIGEHAVDIAVLKDRQKEARRAGAGAGAGIAGGLVILIEIVKEWWLKR